MDRGWGSRPIPFTFKPLLFELSRLSLGRAMTMTIPILALVVITLVCSKSVLVKQPPKPKPADQELGEAFAKVLKALKESDQIA